MQFYLENLIASLLVTKFFASTEPKVFKVFTKSATGPPESL